MHRLIIAKRLPMPDKMLFADIILPLPLANLYTYSIPANCELERGMRVMVPVQKKIYTGIVYSIHNHQPTEFKVKEIISVLDNQPIVTNIQLDFWEWISNYYQSFMGDVYKAALPAGLKLESETQVVLLSEYDEDILEQREQKVVNILINKKNLSVKELQKYLGIKNTLPLLKSLLEKGIIAIDEKIIENYKVKKEDYIRLSSNFEQEEQLQQALSELKKAKKQHEMLLVFLDLSHFPENKEVAKKTLLQHTQSSHAVLMGLIKKNILTVYSKEISRIDLSEAATIERYALNPHQQKAHEEIQKSFELKNVVLLHGVTSSGKTEIYIHLIEEALKTGKQVLYLLPEIALTSQLTTRLKRFFGNKLGVYHSRFADAERVEIWNNLLKNSGYQIILGVRSSVFLPFQNLGLVIVDEEHENTYKQYDPAPRYHARNAAIVLGHLHKAKVLLGSATPSIESYNNALSGKYGLVELLHRHEEIALPQILAVDTKELRRKKIMKSFFSPILIEKINETLEKEEQVILFQNRRGFSPYIECMSCSYIPKCKNCDVSLTVHKAFNALTCHYCGYTEAIPHKCPKCSHEEMEKKGFGTERIEDEVSELFPTARIARMDMDTTRTKSAYEKIISEFENKQVDILIGTQMISKGLDFEHVSLVGILNADNLLNFPDFRSHERAFQLITQVSGRAGRKNKQGLVLLQTSDVSHLVIQQVVANDYKAMFKSQMQERELFKYPPYYRLIYILLKHRDLSTLNKASSRMSDLLRATFGSRILGPDNPPITRIQNLFLKRIVLKIEAEASNMNAKYIIHEVAKKITSIDEFKSLQIHLDVDPM